MLSHALDFDDTHADSICHVSVVSVPAALAAAETTGSSGRELLTAVVIGNEVMTRIGSVAAAEYMRRGFHPTSACGVFGAAAAASRLLHLGLSETVSAFGIAGSMASGVFAYLSDGSSTKPIHAGWAACGGLTAAKLAAAGGEGPRHIFEDRYGFFAAYYERPDRGLAEQLSEFANELSDLGDRWETTRIALKRYPACHFIHACLDAAQSLTASNQVDVRDISRIAVAVPEPGIPLVLEPAAAKADPRTPYDAKFSLAFSIAAALVRGHVDVTTYDSDTIRDPRILALAKLVEYETRPFPTYPQAFPGWVRIETAMDEPIEQEVPYQRGGPENPMAEREIVAKFHRNASLAVDSAAAKRIEDAVLSLDAVDNVASCFADLGHAVPAGVDA
jgi:2-methylcitrate dehydratase PrpD